MIRRVFFVLFILMICAPCADARDLIVKRTIEGYFLSTRITRNPPVIGKNDVLVEIRDASGKPVAGASVWVNYFMPPMPGMAPMNYTIPAKPHNSLYAGTMDLIMRGPWNINVKAAVAGKMLRMTVVIDVR